MSNIPEARDRIIMLMSDPDTPTEIVFELGGILALLYRVEPLYSRAPVRAYTATPEVKERLRQYKRLNPFMTGRDIGRVFNVDGGRVSEAIHGKD